MFVAGYFFIAIGKLLNTVLEIYKWIVIIRALITWVRPDPYNPIVRFLSNIVDPVTYRISRIIPTRIGMVDVSPFILFALILLAQWYLVPVFFEAGARLH